MAWDNWVPCFFHRDAAKDVSEEQTDTEADYQYDAEYHEVAHLVCFREDSVVEEEEGEFDAASEEQVDERPDGKPLEGRVMLIKKVAGNGDEVLRFTFSISVTS